MNEPLEEFPRDGVALVFGGSGDIGAATCRRLAQGGAKVALTYFKNRAPSEALAEELGQGTRIYQLDTEDLGAVEAVIADCVETDGHIHTVVIAAGANIRLKYLSEISVEEWQAAVKTDMFGGYNIVKTLLHVFRQQRQGNLVLVSTAALARYSPKDALSTGPKGGLEALIYAVAREEGKFGVRANVLSLGVIDGGIMNRFWADLSPEFTEVIKQSNALRRMGTPAEAAEAIVFLASARASYITGQRLCLDGGYSI